MKVWIESVDGGIRLRWEDVADAYNIYLADSPEGFDPKTSYAHVSGKTVLEFVDLPETTRYYFKVVPDIPGSAGVVTAERRVGFESAVNFRDLGGYPARDGWRVKWGRVYRSDSLAKFTDTDLALFQHLGIRTVCDFRTSSEVAIAPDRLPQGAAVEYCHLPVTSSAFDTVAAMEKLRNGDTSWLTENFMRDGYHRNIDMHAPKWGAVFNRLATADAMPLVFHCTAGKDRTGICAALILLCLGVPEAIVLEDHALSNIYFREKVESINAYLESIGVAPEKVAPYLTAPPEAMAFVLDYLKKRFGSAEEYLISKAGVSRKTMARIKTDLLEPYPPHTNL